MRRRAAAPPGAKKRDYWWTVFFTDPIAVPLVRLLSRHRVLSPDQVSIVAALLGLAVGPVFAFGTRVALIVGGVLFQVAFIVDCIDGKLARDLGVSSPRGAALDALGDATRRASASLGLVLGLWSGEEWADGAALWAVAYVVLAYLFIELSGGSEIRQTAWFKKDEGGGGRVTAPEPTGWSGALAKRRLLPTPGMPDVQAIAFILGPVTGFVVPGLLIGSAMVAAGILVSLWRRLR